MEKVFYGVDLGKKGGIVVLKNGAIIHKEVMPLVADEDVDVKAIGRIFKKFGVENAHVVFEKFSGFFGYNKNAAVSLSRQSGMIESLIILMGIPYTKVLPKTWQKVVWENTKMLEKADGKKDTKAISLVTAKRLFPKENFILPKCKKEHDGLIDALLLAEYGRRKGL